MCQGLLASMLWTAVKNCRDWPANSHIAQASSTKQSNFLHITWHHHVYMHHPNKHSTCAQYYAYIIQNVHFFKQYICTAVYESYAQLTHILSSLKDSVIKLPLHHKLYIILSGLLTPLSGVGKPVFQPVSTGCLLWHNFTSR